MAGVFTHNGNIVEGLPSAANMINYDNTSSGMQATQLQAAVDELNTNKQSKTDNSLTTTDKTITGGINELKSGLTNLDNEVNGDATVYPYADVITIEDAVPSNLADCSVKIEPEQDLHGYDKPWVGGAGDNKMYLNPSLSFPIEQNGVTITSDGNGGVYLNGTSTNAVQVISAFKTDTLSGQNTICKLASEEHNGVVYAGSSPSGSYTSNTYGYDTVTADGSWRLDIYISQAGRTFNNLHLQPMVIMGNSHPTEYSPYTNICPISGHTQASVQRDGKNLCFRGEGNIYNGGGLIPVDVGNKIYCYGKWTSSSTTNMYGAVFDTANQSDKNTGRLQKFSNFQSGNISVCTVSQKGYFGVCFNSAASDYEVQEMMISRTPITSATDYEPFKGQTYTIALGDTIYGGTVDFDSGVMTVDRAFVDLGALNYTYDSTDIWFKAPVSNMKLGDVRTLTMLCECYKCIDDGRPFAEVPDSSVWNSGGSSEIYIRDTRYINPSDLATALNGMKLVYPIATPTTIQLTPQQIQLLKGTNTLYASTGQISVTVNGVSGAIGSVQEQVNELAEEVTDIEEDVTAINNSIGWSGEFICKYNSQYELTTIGVTDNDGLTGLQVRDSGIISLYVAGTKIWSAQLTIS